MCPGIVSRSYFAQWRVSRAWRVAMRRKCCSVLSYIKQRTRGHFKVRVMSRTGNAFLGTLWGAFGNALGLRTEVWRGVALRGNFVEMRAAAYRGLALRLWRCVPCAAWKLRGNAWQCVGDAYKGLACLALRGVALGVRRAVKTDAWGFVAFCGRCCANHPWQYLRTMLSFGPFAPCNCHFCLRKSANSPSHCSFAVILIGGLPDRAHTRLSIAGVGAVMDERPVLALLRAQWLALLGL